MNIEKRPNWIQYFMKFADLAKSRSTCLRRGVGAVAVRDRQILATGYNGAPKGVPHCESVGCLRESLKVPSGTQHELCNGVHAEQNVIIQAAYQGVSLNGAELYTTSSPCSICMKMLINAGITKILYREVYEDQRALDLARKAEIGLFHLKE